MASWDCCAEGHQTVSAHHQPVAPPPAFPEVGPRDLPGFEERDEVPGVSAACPARGNRRVHDQALRKHQPGCDPCPEGDGAEEGLHTHCQQLPSRHQAARCATYQGLQERGAGRER